MGKIFYLMGKSGAGKDTVYKRILERSENTLKTIVMYTTRPIRAGETDGLEYFFADEDKLQEFEVSKNLIELREYRTFHGIWKYFTVKDSQLDLEKNDYLIIGTPESYNKTKAFFGEDKLVPILIELDDGERLQRALERERKQEHPRYQELCRRYLADDEDFSQERLEEAGIAVRFYNDDLEHCIQEILDYIEKKRR